MKTIERLNHFFSEFEKRNGIVLTSLLIGLVFFAFDMIYVTPSFHAMYNGLQYSLLSIHPFDFSVENPLRFRIIPSLIGYITFLRGDLFFILPLIFCLIFISVMYHTYRKKNFSPIDSILFTGFISFSSTMLIQIVAPGYTDVILYFFLFLSFFYSESIRISALFFSLALLTHESSLFLLPGLILYKKSNDKKLNLNRTLFFFLLSILPMIIYRYWVSSNTFVKFDVNFYFSKNNVLFSVHKALEYFPVGAFFAFKLFWIFPLTAIYLSYRKKEFQLTIILLSIIIGTSLQLIFAYDTTRMICLAFPAILIAAEKLRSEWEPMRFTKLSIRLTLVNFLVIQCFVNSDGIVPMLPLLYTALMRMFL